jgi:hypothetical protein
MGWQASYAVHWSDSLAYTNHVAICMHLHTYALSGLRRFTFPCTVIELLISLFGA